MNPYKVIKFVSLYFTFTNRETVTFFYKVVSMNVVLFDNLNSWGALNLLSGVENTETKFAVFGVMLSSHRI